MIILRFTASDNGPASRLHRGRRLKRKGILKRSVPNCSLERKKKSWENFYLFFSAKTFAGLNGTVTGWGATAESGAISQTLQEVTVPILSNADCRASKYPSQRITDNMLCAGYKEGSKDSCQVINNKFFFSVIVTINTSPLLTTYTNGNCYVFVHLHLLCVYHLIYT